MDIIRQYLIVEQLARDIEQNGHQEIYGNSIGWLESIAIQQLTTLLPTEWEHDEIPCAVESIYGDTIFHTSFKDCVELERAKAKFRGILNFIHEPIPNYDEFVSPYFQDDMYW